jgi:hypothetical protein
VMFWLLVIELLVSLVRTPHLLSTLRATDSKTWLELLGLWLCVACAIESTKTRLKSRAETKRA